MHQFYSRSIYSGAHLGFLVSLELLLQTLGAGLHISSSHLWAARGLDISSSKLWARGDLWWDDSGVLSWDGILIFSIWSWSATGRLNSTIILAGPLVLALLVLLAIFTVVFTAIFGFLIVLVSLK